MRFYIAFLISLAFLLTSCSTESNYKTGVIDCGVVVKDIKKSVEFYKKIGFSQIAEFEVPKKVAGDAGLVNYRNVSVKVMSLNGVSEGTKIKLMEGYGNTTGQGEYIDSNTGISYLTLFVKDAGLTLNMLRDKGIKVLNKGPVDLGPAGFSPNFLIVIRDPDGNFIEFVGPILTD